MTQLVNLRGGATSASEESAHWYYVGCGALAHRDWRAAQAGFERAAPQLRERAEWSLLWHCLIAMALNAWRDQNGGAALEYAREAHALTDRLDGAWTRAWSAWLLGHLHAAHHQLAEAAAFFTAAAGLLDDHDDDQRTIRHLSVVAALHCADEAADRDVLAERIFGLARLACRIGLRRGLPLAALEDIGHAPQFTARAGADVFLDGRTPLDWMRPLAPYQDTRAYAHELPSANAAVGTLPDEEVEPAQDHDHPPDLRVYCLGGFQVWRGSTLVTEWAGMKCKTLLKLLVAAYPTMLSAIRLMDVVWPGVEEELARQRLHTAISDLRRTLRAVAGEHQSLIVSQNGCYGFDPRAAIWIDAREFERAQHVGQHYAQTGRSEQARRAFHEAITLYRGAFLEEDIYEEWPVEQRERLSSAYLLLLVRLGQWAFAAQDYEGCLGYARLMLECDPCREDAHRLLMRSYSRLGQRAAALRQYRQCTDALRRGLDAVPETETDELCRALQQGREL